MNCKYCSNPIPPGSARCPSCGAPAPEAPPPLPPPPPPPPPHYAPPPYAPPPYVPPPPPVVIYTNPPPVRPVSPPKSRSTFIVLGVLLGEFGIHNFYAGYTGRGIVQLLLTVVGLPLFGLLGGVAWIWALVEVCTVSVDSKKVPMK